MAKIIKILFVIIGVVAVLGTAYFAVLKDRLEPTVQNIRGNFIDFLPVEWIVIIGLVAFAIVVALVYSFID